MLYATSAQDAARTAKAIPVNGRDYVLSGYVGASPIRGTYVEGAEQDDDGRPQGFLVEQPPGAVTEPHFHEVDQFQVVVGGSGRIGKFPAKPITVQYANGHTPYGPVVADGEGITYFTLRAGWDPGAKYMPASRDKLQKGNQRARIAGDIELSHAADLAARTAAGLDPVIEPEADGMAAHILRLGAGSSVETPDPASGGGQYLVVVNGSLLHDGKEYSELSCLFQTADEAALEATAGGRGLEILVLQFPRA